jgi:kinesin family protein C2/C3
MLLCHLLIFNCRLANERREDWQYEFKAGVIEIYNENIYDLLAGGREQDDQRLDIKQGPEGMYVTNQKVCLHLSLFSI